ncbi:MAG: type II toxin-antitoxin system VapC family toxin [Actinomycetota bacterium]|nr:type II toxin-antitoxin system VapC family toxin [Actinomycetota bacterium]
MSFLVDTNVLSEARKPRRADLGVTSWLASSPPEQLYLSVLVIGEVRRGADALARRDPRQAAVFADWLLTVRRDYAERILPVTEAIADQWGRMNAVRRLPAIDGLMAATAVVHGLTLVTRNERAVDGSGAQTFNPFSG